LLFAHETPQARFGQPLVYDFNAKTVPQPPMRPVDAPPNDVLNGLNGTCLGLSVEAYSDEEPPIREVAAEPCTEAANQAEARGVPWARSKIHMRRWNLRHYASSCAAAALLAGCGGAQPPVGAPSATPQALPMRAKSSYKELYRFGPQKYGTYPAAGLLYVNGALYGTTTAGGLKYGTIYSISASGVHKVLYRFHGGSDGSDPQSGLINVNGTLYGTTAGGGSSNAGTVYSISTSDAEKVLYAFKGGSDGAHPRAGLIDVKGKLYGTTFEGGSGCFGVGCGTVFSVTTSGEERVLHSFNGHSDGAYPVAELIDVKGVLYGTTSENGNCGACGTVYRITPAGAEKVLHAFQDVSDGYGPQSGLINVNGMLYGTTEDGGQNGSGCDGQRCGTVYSVSTTGTEKIIYRFADGTDGALPAADLIDVNGVLYGTTTMGGGAGSCWTVNGNCGTVFSVTTDGQETVLYRFAGSTDGFSPAAPLTNVKGTLYGTTYHGGNRDTCCHVYGWGTVFALEP
jgi:uncharacterized repeat protein (TIGR03803 family)